MHGVFVRDRRFAPKDHLGGRIDRAVLSPCGCIFGGANPLGACGEHSLDRYVQDYPIASQGRVAVRWGRCAQSDRRGILG